MSRIRIWLMPSRSAIWLWVSSFVEAEAHDLGLPLGQGVEQLVDQQPHLDPAAGGLAAGQPAAQRPLVVVAGAAGVEAGGPVGGPCLHRAEDLVLGHPSSAASSPRWAGARAHGQAGPGPAKVEMALLGRQAAAPPGRAVPEVALDLAVDSSGWRRTRRDPPASRRSARRP